MTTNAQRQIRLVIADTHPLFRDGLSSTIRQDSGLRLVAELGDGRAALDSIRRSRPEVAVLDVDLPQLGGRRVLEAVRRDQLETRVVLITADISPDVAFSAVAAGAAGYLSKRVSGQYVRHAVRRVAAGASVLCDELQTLMTREIRLRHRDDSRLLSPREHDVLVLIAEGMSAPQIAQQLCLAPSTVKGYIAQIYERLGVRERAHAVAEAMRRGLLD